MKSLAARLAVALVTFTVGVWLTALVFGRHAPRAVVVTYKVDASPQFEHIKIPSPCESAAGPKGQVDETPEEKAVRLAEEFVARNGYTDLPPDRDGLSYESIEWAGNVEEMLKWRRDSLERKAYGIWHSGRMGGAGWTVVFRHKPRFRNRLGEVGRAVTMDGNFEKLRVEHKSFPLENVHKKLQAGE